MKDGAYLDHLIGPQIEGALGAVRLGDRDLIPNILMREPTSRVQMQWHSRRITCSITKGVAVGVAEFDST